jgi:peptide/nickel transport system substrate-binding protein
MKKSALIVLMSLLLVVSCFSQLVNIPREETLIVNSTHGRATAAFNFNIFTISWQVPSRGVHQLLLESFWVVDYVKGEIINVLASEEPIYNDDFTQMTIKLREGCYWSDGVPITAEDVVYGIKTTMEYPAMANNPSFNEYIDKVYKTDDYTVIFELKKPNPRFHTNFLDRWGAWRPFPKHIFEKVEDPVAYEFYPPVSSGPYIVKEVDPAGYWTLYEKREDWERTPTGMLYGEPKPKYVLFQAFTDPTAQIIAQANHNLDMTNLSAEGFKVVLDRNSYARGYRKEYPWIPNQEPTITGLTLNNECYPFNLKDVRWALTLAIDIVDYIAIAFDGTAIMGSLHIPATPSYKTWYYDPMEEWLKNFTLDIEIKGEPFKPYDPDAAIRLAEYARERGYEVPEDSEEIKELFGPGWWKYAPDVAEQLLLRNGFKRDKNGKWLLPDGTPWKISIVTYTDTSHPQYRNALAASQQWKSFGIETNVRPSEAVETLEATGDFEVGSVWPAPEPWGGHPDLFKVLSIFHSKNYRPLGEFAISNPGGASRWTEPRMDKIINEMEKIDWNDPRNLELGMEGLKILVEEMPTIPTFAFPAFIVWDEYYWTNYPGAENPYGVYHFSWPNLKYMLPYLEPTGRK